MTAAEKARLEALKAKQDKTAEEQAELDALLAKETLDDKEQTYGEAYVKGLRQEAAKYRTKMREYEERLSAFDGLEPDKIQELLREKEENEKKKLEEKGQFATLKEQLIEAHKAELVKKATELQERDAKIQSLEAQLNNTIMANEIATAASVAKAINPKLVEMVALQNMNVETLEDGRRVIRILDKEGQARIDLKTGQPLSVVQYIEEMKQLEEYAHLFAGAKPGAGSGTTFTFQGAKVNNPWKKDTFNLTMQGQILKNDPTLAARLKEEAGV